MWIWVLIVYHVIAVAFQSMRTLGALMMNLGLAELFVGMEF